jgi:hypothetical protein
MALRFVGLVGSLPPDEQQIWLPNQLVHYPQTWVAPHFLQLKSEYAVILNKHNCKEQEMCIVKTSLFLLLRISYYRLFQAFTRLIREIRRCLSRGFSTVMPLSQHTLSKQMMKNMNVWEDNIKKTTNKRILVDVF